MQSEDVYDVATNKLGQFYHTEVPKSFFDTHRGISDEVFYREFKKELGLDVDIDELTRNGQRLLWDEFTSSIHYTPGFLEFFSKAKTMVKHVALVTATPRPLLTKIFETSNINVDFDHIITASDVVETKPAPEPYEKMCAHLGVSPERALVIEDSPTGLRSAVSAGCQAVGISTSCERDSLNEANFVVDSFGELEELLTTV